MVAKKPKGYANRLLILRRGNLHSGISRHACQTHSWLGNTIPYAPFNPFFPVFQPHPVHRAQPPIKIPFPMKIRNHQVRYRQECGGIYRLLNSRLRWRRTESLYTVLFDAENELWRCERILGGHSSSAPAYPKMAFSVAPGTTIFQNPGRLLYSY